MSEGDPGLDGGGTSGSLDNPSGGELDLAGGSSEEQRVYALTEQQLSSYKDIFAFFDPGNTGYFICSFH